MTAVRRLRLLAAHLATPRFDGAVPTAPTPNPTVQAPTVVDEDIEVLDYAYSFITNPGPANAVRFWIESRTVLIDDNSGERTVFYQCASCKSENTFGAYDLFAADNYDFCPVYGAGSLVIFRRYLPGGSGTHTLDEYKDVRPGGSQGWAPGGGEQLRLWPAKQAYELPIGDFAAIRAATADAIPLVSQTEIADASSGLRAIIECPVKTMNLSLEGGTNSTGTHDAGVWQIDTGPVAVPDLAKKYDPAVACVSLGYIATNNRQSEAADFVLEQPTTGPGGEKVLHFSSPFSVKATNRIFAIPLPDA